MGPSSLTQEFAPLFLRNVSKTGSKKGTIYRPILGLFVVFFSAIYRCLREEIHKSNWVEIIPSAMSGEGGKMDVKLDQQLRWCLEMFEMWVTHIFEKALSSGAFIPLSQLCILHISTKFLKFPLFHKNFEIPPIFVQLTFLLNLLFFISPLFWPCMRHLFIMLYA